MSKGSEQAAGFDLYSIEKVSIPPQHVGVVDTGIAAVFPPHTYGRVASRSGLAIKHSIEVGGGVIDPDYTGNIRVILHNFGSETFHVEPQDHIAQLIIEQFKSPPITISASTPQTKRAQHGFGSTGIKNSLPSTYTASDTSPSPIPYRSDELDATSHAHVATLRHDIHSCQLEMNFQQPVFTTTVHLRKNSKYPMLGLQLVNDERGPLIVSCTPGSPATKVHCWRHVLKQARIHSINTANKLSFILSLKKF